MFRLITDFDGPIMDVSERYYRVYRYCVARVTPANEPLRELSKVEFWHLKQSQVSEQEIGLKSGLTADRARDFARLRRETVHSTANLVFDRPLPGAVAALEKAKSLGWDLVVMTMRRQRELDEALDRCSLRKYFDRPHQRYCLDDHYTKTRDIDDKPLLMERAFSELPPAAATWMVGDTEADIAAARKAGVPIVSVLSGIRNQDRLSEHKPDFIVANLSEAIRLIVSETSHQAS